MIMKNFTTGLIAAVIIAAAGYGVHAIGVANEEGFDDVASRLFISQDENNDNLIKMSESDNYAQLAFISMDSDEDGSINREEFLAWDPGFIVVGQRAGKSKDVNAVKMQAFTAADTDGSDSVDLKEMTTVTQSGFFIADADENAALTFEEFTDGFPIVAYIGMALNS